MSRGIFQYWLASLLDMDDGAKARMSRATVWIMTVIGVNESARVRRGLITCRQTRRSSEGGRTVGSGEMGKSQTDQ